MEPAFWDSSSLVPLCVRQQATPVAQALSQRHSMNVWWGAPVEIRGAFTRLLRMRQLTSNEAVGARVRLDELRYKWREVFPGDELRDQAELLVDRFPLKAADALQLAAAMAWCLGRPKGRGFISGDRQLLDAAKQLGFQALQA
jgi:predicted nucleic acid-binding protein